MKPGVGMTARWPFGAVLGVGTTPPTTGPIDVISTYPGGTLLSTGDGGAVAEVHQGSPWEEEARERQVEALEQGGRNIYEEGLAGPVEERQSPEQVRETAERHQQRSTQRGQQRQADDDEHGRERQTGTRRSQPRSTDKEE
jgi:hypothetical protein